MPQVMNMTFLVALTIHVKYITITITMKKRQEKTLAKQLAQHELVTLAVYLLGGDQHAVDTEDVAIKAHELAPGRFSWQVS